MPVPSLFSPDDIVLVVDDDPAVRSIIAWRMARLGCTVIEAGSAEDALEIARSVGFRVSVLVTDIGMPGTNGYALGARLAERCPGLRILYVTGDLADDLLGVAGAPHCCVSAVLEKPFDSQALLGALSDLLARAPVRA